MPTVFGLLPRGGWPAQAGDGVPGNAEEGGVGSVAGAIQDLLHPRLQRGRPGGQERRGHCAAPQQRGGGGHNYEILPVSWLRGCLVTRFID